MHGASWLRFDRRSLLRIEAAERAVVELAGAFDRRFRSDSPFPPVVIALALRSRSLYSSFLHSLNGPAPIAALALIRPLVEINILLRFISCAPDLRSRLWIAERDRWSAGLVR